MLGTVMSGFIDLYEQHVGSGMQGYRVVHQVSGPVCTVITED